MIRIAAALLSLVALVAPAHGQLGERAVKFILPVATASGVDTITRAAEPALSKALRAPIVIENQPGAGGIVGTSALVKAPPDGYTLSIVSNNHVIYPSVYKSVPFDPIADITPIAVIGSTPIVIVVNSKVPAKNAQELIALLKANPGKYNYGSSGNGTILHLATEMFLDEDFGDLDGIERRPFAEIVGDDPHVEAMWDGGVAADAADIDRIFAGRFGRGHIALVGAVVDDRDAGRLAQHCARPLLAEGPFEFDIDRLPMADENGDAHASRGHCDVGVEDLSRLGRHLPFFLGRAVVHEDVAMRDHVEGDLFGEMLGFERIVDVDRAGLVEQFVHRGAAGSRHRLIRRDDDALYAGDVVQRLQRDDHLDGRAVRIGDDAALRVLCDRLGIYLRHDQRHVRLHAEARGVVDDYCASLRRTRREDVGHLGAGRGKDDVDAAEIVSV